MEMDERFRSFFNKQKENQQEADVASEEKEDSATAEQEKEVAIDSAAIVKEQLGSYNDGSVIEIPTADLIELEDNPYNAKDEEGLQTLADDIREAGLIHELIVRDHPQRKGKYQVLCGNNRLRACRDILGMESIRCKYRKFDTEDEAYSMVVKDNELNRNVTPVEKARAIHLRLQKMKENQDYGSGDRTSEIVARDFAINKSDVYRWEKADRLSSDYKNLFNTGDIKLSTAEILGSLPEEVQNRIWKVSGGKKLTAEQAGNAKAILALDDETTDDQLKLAIFAKEKKTTVKQPPVRYKAHVYDWDKLTPEEREKFVVKALEAYSADARAKAMHQREQEMTEQSLLDAGQQQLPLDEEHGDDVNE